jgi:hypothetical protein
MKGLRARGIPCFVEDDSSLLAWESDSYLVDRKKLFKSILESDERIDILELHSKSSVSLTNLAKLLNELVESYGAKNIDERTILISKKVKLSIFINRKEIFTPRLTKVWKLIPKSFKNEN